MRPVGYLINTEKGLAGEPGLFYNYILAENGLFVKAESPLLAATVCIGFSTVRGLQPLEEKVDLPKGKIPIYIYNIALSVFFSDRRQEHYLAVIWDGEYRIVMPEQERSECQVKYKRLPSTILDIHSHGAMGPSFSFTDDIDEQGLRLYMVVGKLDTLVPEQLVRVGVYGYFAPIEFEEVFGV